MFSDRMDKYSRIRSSVSRKNQFIKKRLEGPSAVVVGLARRADPVAQKVVPNSHLP